MNGKIVTKYEELNKFVIIFSALFNCIINYTK